jgi:predicted nucleotidyltransferase
MKTQNAVGIIAEYNPFHNGHAYHLSETRRIVGYLPIIAVMSGNFVQRGLPALTDKWSRSIVAVQNGVDLVLELPAIFSCRSAEHFARGAISLLKATGCVSHLAFGCEEKNLDLLLAAAAALETTHEGRSSVIAKGLSYAAAVGWALSAKNPALKDVIDKPNNILAIEYLRHCQKLSAPFTPVAVCRKDSSYNDTVIKGKIASATAIRQEFLQNGFSEKVADTLPQPTKQALSELLRQQKLGYMEENLDTLLLHALRQLSAQDIKERCECSKAWKTKYCGRPLQKTMRRRFNDKSKRYPETRINRLLLQILLSSPDNPFKGAVAELPSYIRVLAFNDRGRHLLKQMRQTSEFQ